MAEEGQLKYQGNLKNEILKNTFLNYINITSVKFVGKYLFLLDFENGILKFEFEQMVSQETWL